MNKKKYLLRSIRRDLVPGFLAALGKSEPEAQGDHRPELARALVADAMVARATDIHVEPRTAETRLRLRIDGTVVDAAPLTKTQAKWLLNQFKALANLDPIARFTPRDSHARCRFEEYDIDLRLALAPTQSGEALSVRLLDPRRLEIAVDGLGLNSEKLRRLENWLENVNGMFLAAGPTGSGKTTTIYALLHELKFANRIVVSLEDPVEYQVDGITQVQLDEKHHLDFAEGVKSMLRLDPDFLVMGEIRDACSAKAATSAAVSGRVLLSTIHSRDAVGVLTALRNWDLADHEIAEALSVVVAQRLVRKLCPECREEIAATDNDIEWFRALNLSKPAKMWRPAGCKQCNHLGYAGRTAVFELWQLDEQDHELILTHADECALRRHLARSKHSTFLEDAFTKLENGVTSLEELKKLGASPLIEQSGL